MSFVIAGGLDLGASRGGGGSLALCLLRALARGVGLGLGPEPLLVALRDLRLAGGGGGAIARLLRRDAEPLGLLAQLRGALSMANRN